jgi:MoaA/NifB/PqqE/SkfB family radical SAM enzyme
MGWRELPLDGSVLLFDRDRGTNALITNEATRHLRREAPRVIQVAITNACDKSCSFCYRPMDAKSRWTFDELLALAHACDDWGVLELAFGGGEPTLFPRFDELLRAIWSQTTVCPSFTTHGLHLDAEFLRSIRGAYGQIQLSVYDEDDTPAIIDLLVRERARFGLNYLVTPSRVRTLEADVAAFVDRGVRDILMLSYKGADSALHLSEREVRMFDASLAKLHELFGGGVDLKVDVCWGSRLVVTPQLLDDSDCGANVDFLSITSDKRVLSCSFAHGGVPFREVSEIRTIWRSMQDQRIEASSPGCARLAGFGLQQPQRLLRVVR